MSVETILTLIAAAGAVTGIILNWWNAHKKTVGDETAKERRDSSIEIKLDGLIDDVKEIKLELKSKDKTYMEHEIRIANIEKRIEQLEKKVGL